MLAIVSSEKEYRYCHYLNKNLAANFVLREPLQWPANKNDEIISYPVYVYNYPDELNRVFFIVNKKGGHVLLTEQRQADFIMVFEGPDHSAILHEFNPLLKSIPFTQATFAVKPENLKSINKLEFD